MNPDIQKAGQRAIEDIRSNRNLARDPKKLDAVFSYVEDLEVACGIREAAAPVAADAATPATAKPKSEKKSK